MNPTRTWIVLLALATAGPARLASAVDPPLLGFTAESSAEQRTLEERFDASVRRRDLRDWMQRLSARPHHLGSPYGKENAEFMAGLFRSWGYDTRIEEFQVLFPTPQGAPARDGRAAPVPGHARRAGAAGGRDLGPGERSSCPIYNAYSIDGDVTGELVYVNYGVPADYEELARRGIDVKGKIVIARYGGSWRGIKPKVAAEHGAVGCLIYSDPRDDGYFQGDVYPKGGWRPETRRAARLGRRHAALSGRPADARRRRDAGREAPDRARRRRRSRRSRCCRSRTRDAAAAARARSAGRWRRRPGAARCRSPITSGPARRRSTSKLAFDWNAGAGLRRDRRRCAGAERPDEWIVRGNHHDAWVNGADRPAQRHGRAAGRGQGDRRAARAGLAPDAHDRLRRLGRRGAGPARLDGMGGDPRRRAAAEGAVAYINTDSNGRGFLGVGGSHTLRALGERGRARRERSRRRR